MIFHGEKSFDIHEKALHRCSIKSIESCRCASDDGIDKILLRHVILNLGGLLPTTAEAVKEEDSDGCDPSARLKEHQRAVDPKATMAEGNFRYTSVIYQPRKAIG